MFLTSVVNTSRLETMPSLASAADHIQDLGAYVSASPSSFHAVHEAARRLEEAAFMRLDELEPWEGGPGRFFIIRDGALIAWVVPEGAGPATAFNILGAHHRRPRVAAGRGGGVRRPAAELLAGP
jgi:aspartyl aminopeptidase